MINLYLISESQLPFVVLTISFSLTNYYFVCIKSNTTGVASGTGRIHSSVSPTCVHHPLQKSSGYSSFSFLCSAISIIDILFVLFPFDHWYSLCSATQRVWLVEQEVSILMCHPPVFIPVLRRIHVFQALVSSVVLCWSLIVFLFCFLLIIDCLSVLFPFDHW